MRHDIAQKRKERFLLLSPPHLSMLGDLALASDNMTRIVTLNWGNGPGNGGHFFLESGKMCQHFFFHDCNCTSLDHPLSLLLIFLLVWAPYLSSKFKQI